VDIVIYESDVVLCAKEKHGPVVVTVAAGRPGCSAVKFVVRDGYATSSFVARDNHLTAGEGKFAVINPDQVSADLGCWLVLRFDTGLEM
jgi:hypothetical protein